MRTLQVVVYAVLLSTIVFFGLTRTEVGRDGLRQQIEAQFASQFEGSLHVDRLQGNLINDLYASGVEVRDPSGRTVIQVDSVVARPRWANLLGREVSLRSVELWSPRVHAHRDSSGTWTLEDAFAPVPPSRSDDPLDLSLADVQIRDGHLTTTRDGAAPDPVRSGWLFDYSRATARNVSARLTAEWSPSERIVEFYEVSADVPAAGVSLAQAQGQAVRTGTKWSLSQVRVQTGRSDVRVRGSVERFETQPPEFDVRLGKSRIDFDEVRRVVPRLPLQDAVTIEGSLLGPVSGFVVRDVRVARGESQFILGGTATGLPDSLRYDIELRETRLRVDDVQAVVDAPLPRIAQDLERLDASLLARGVVHFRERAGRPSYTLDADVDLASPHGAVDGAVNLARSPGRAPRYRVDVLADSLNAALVTGRPALDSRLTGRLRVDGRGVQRDSLNSTLRLDLGPSRIAEQVVDSASVDVTLAGRTGSGTVDVQQRGGGRLQFRGAVDATADSTTYDLSARTDAFDLAPLPGSLPATSLNATLTAEGTGLSWEAASLAAGLSVDTSRIRRGDSIHVVPGHHVALRVRPSAGSRPYLKRIQVDGDVLSATVRGNLDVDALSGTARLWGTALRNAVLRELDKPMPRSVATASVDAYATPPPNATADAYRSPEADSLREAREAMREAVRRTLDERGYTGPLTIEADATVHRTGILAAWLPDLPPLANGLTTRVQTTADADTLRAEAFLSSDAYSAGPAAVDTLRTVGRLSASLRAPLAETLSARLDVSGTKARVGSLSVAHPTLSLKYERRRGAIRIQTDRRGTSGPFRVGAALDVEDRRNVLHVQEVFASIGSITWQNERTSDVDLYSDAILVEPLRLQSPHPRDGDEQRIVVSGRLSSNPDDVLSARTEGVLLHPVSELLKLNRPVAGRLDGRVEMSGGWRTPEVSADLDVGHLSFDRRLLGRVDVSASYASSSPNLNLDLRLSPDTTAIGAPLLPGGTTATEENRLRLSGRIRLPIGPDDAATNRDTQPGSDETLDLTLDVERADLFFFEYIFEETITNVRGYTAGTAQISGYVTDPLFDADMRVEEGRFRLPRFNLRYAIDGDVRVDEAGIHLAGVSVRDSDDGAASIDGSILFNDYRFFSFEMSGVLDEMTVINVKDSPDLPFYGMIRASGPVSLNGPLPDATLSSPGVSTTPNSELFIPVEEEDVDEESGFLIFADSTGQLPDLQNLTQRDNLLADRPAGEPSFLDGLELDLNIQASSGSTVHLVFDPLVGDVVTAIGSGRVQLQRQEGEFFVYGTYEVEGGDYLFTAGEVFVRRFSIESGTLTWDGDPVNAQLDLNAAYRTRASPAGLPNEDQYAGRIPVIVELDITGRVETPRVDLSLAIARDERSSLVGNRTLDAILNQPELATEYATSVLLTNTFLLTTSTLSTGGASQNEESNRLAEAGNQLAFNSVSQLVASQLNRYLNEALPNVDVNFGVSGEDPEDLDIIYGVALRLLNERLIIRGEGIYTGSEPEQTDVRGPQGEFVVEVRLSSSVSVEVFYRRAGDDVTRQTLTNTTGAGLSYQTEFSTWKRLFYRIFGWLLPGDPPKDEDTPNAPEESASPESPPSEPSTQSNAEDADAENASAGDPTTDPPNPDQPSTGDSDSKKTSNSSGDPSGDALSTSTAEAISREDPRSGTQPRGSRPQFH